MKQLILLFLFTISASAQIKGVVKDSVTKEPIAYVSVWVENKNIGASTELDGAFEINSLSDVKLQFSILGYKNKVAKINENGVYYLVSEDLKIEEVVIIKNKKNSKTFKLGHSNKSNVSHLQGKNPQILAKKFEYDTIYKTTPFLKEIEVFTKSSIEDAIFKLRILEFDSIKQLPGKTLLSENIIVKVKKGQRKNVIDVSKYNIEFPTNGIVIGVENIIVDSNKYLYNIKAMPQEVYCYAPAVVLNYVDDIKSYMFMNLKWVKRDKYTLSHGKYKGQKKVIEPAINITLSN
jgi:hypothetical protein